MSRHDKDKLADALNALSGGHEADDTHESIESETQVDESQAAEVSLDPASAPAEKTSRPARPSSPAQPVPAAPAQTPTSTTRPSRPMSPVIGSSPAANPPQTSPQARSSRPAAPIISRAPDATSSTVQPVNYASRKPVAKKKKKSLTGSIEFRRTMIPPCLVVGASFIVMTGLFFLQPESSALRQARVILPIGMGILGFILLAVGAFNMLLVKKELDAHRGQ